MKKVVLTIVCVLIIAAVLLVSAKGVYFMVNRKIAKGYNLVDPVVEKLPEEKTIIEDDYIQLEDVRMHYVRYSGSGHPVILIHGNGGSTESLRNIAKYLANDYTVYAIDSRCQGKSSDPGVISYELMAKDVAQFIEAKGLYKPYVMGHSDGGMVALALASNYPDSLGMCVSTGANSNPKQFKFYFTLGVKFNNLRKKNKLNDLMLNEPDFNEEYLAKIKVPTYVVAGEKDIMKLSDTIYIHEHIANSEIAIVKGGSHSDYVGDGRGYVLTKYFFDKYALE